MIADSLASTTETIEGVRRDCASETAGSPNAECRYSCVSAIAGGVGCESEMTMSRKLKIPVFEPFLTSRETGLVCDAMESGWDFVAGPVPG